MHFIKWLKDGMAVLFTLELEKTGVCNVEAFDKMDHLFLYSSSVL